MFPRRGIDEGEGVGVVLSLARSGSTKRSFLSMVSPCLIIDLIQYKRIAFIWIDHEESSSRK